MEKSPYYSVSQVAKKLGVSVGTIHRWTDAGTLTASRTLGGHRRYLAEEVQRVASHLHSVHGHMEVINTQLFIVTTDLQVIQQFEEVLKGKDYDLVIFSSQRSLHASLVKDEPDLVIVDMDINSGDGTAIVKDLSEKHSDLNVLVLATFGDVDYLQGALQFSPFQIIKKPFSQDIMRRALHAHLEMRSESPTLRTKRRYKKVLLIDDDEVIISSLGESLQDMEGYMVKSASDGYTAGRLISNYKPDLVVLDLLMDGIDGFEICADLGGRSDEDKPVVLILTGYPGGGNKERVLSSGAAEVLEKPISPDVLAQTIASHLES